MTGDSSSLALDISEHLFRLTTECLRLHSNETRCYQTLASLVDERISSACPLEDHPPETIRHHLSAIPTEGAIRITFNITKSSADTLAGVRERFARSLGSNITIGDTVSILLFHYVVGQKAAETLQRLGFDDTAESKGPQAKSDPATENVFPIR